jgi:nickel/cobalt transporter (NicO) family protein
MRRLIFALAVIALGLGVLWALGGLGAARAAIFDAQREFQATLAEAVRALKAGNPGAVTGLIGLGFVYGVLHAAGPGHGKAVLGAWAFSSRATLWRVSAITLAASLAQATSAVALVLGGALVFDLGREALVGIAEGPVTRAGDLVIAALGTWLVWRGLRGFWKMQATDHHHHGDACGCGHDHVPDPDAAARAGWGEALLLIGGVALRPCTGALFVMLLTVLIGAPLVGIAATYAIGLGTALLTLVVALTSASLRDGIAGVGAGRTAHLRAFGHGAELGLGALVIALVI